MDFYAVATVDLDGGVSSTARNTFNEELKKEKFNKHKLTTLWTVRYTTGWTKTSAIKCGFHGHPATYSMNIRPLCCR